jgi:radical SAM protein with 4Fe4S-binding SPASM domain
LIRAKHQHSSIEIRVDCASAFLMRDIHSPAAIRSGIKGCVAGVRILSLSPDGCAYPCSQLVGSAYYAGNLVCDSFEKVWRESDVLNKLRHFRQSAAFVDSVCGKCSANRFCGGCRVFAKDIVGGEVFCPMGIREEIAL